MRAAACLLAVLILAAAGSAIAQEKHLIDPTPPARSIQSLCKAPRVVLRATHEAALAYCSLADLKRFAVDLA